MRYDFIILMNASIQCNNLFLFCIYLSLFSWLGMRYILLLCNISISMYGESPIETIETIWSFGASYLS